MRTMIELQMPGKALVIAEYPEIILFQDKQNVVYKDKVYKVYYTEFIVSKKLFRVLVTRY